MSYVKFCPRCKTTTGIDAAICPHCGHRYRTHFQPPVSEKTIAMTSLDYPSARNTDDVSRRFHIPRIFLVAIILLIAVGLALGIKARHARQSAEVHPVFAAGFQPYNVVVRGDAQGRPVPLAPHSVEDLTKWEAARLPGSQSGGSAADNPARVHLYLSDTIVLVADGTAARVIQEQGQWRRIELLDGLHRGMTGYVNQDDVLRPRNALTATAPMTKSP